MFEMLTETERATLGLMLGDGLNGSVVRERLVIDQARRVPSAETRRKLLKSIRGMASVRSEIRGLMWKLTPTVREPNSRRWSPSHRSAQKLARACNE